MSADPTAVAVETRQQRFERILSLARFEGLKAIIQRLAPDREALQAAIAEASNYEQFLARLGHKLLLTKQIHVQDAYTRMTPDGGIKAVLPYYDIPTQGSMPTLVHFDSSLTTTPKGAAFFDGLLGELKGLLTAPV